MEFCFAARADAGCYTVANLILARDDAGGIKTDQVSGRTAPALTTLDVHKVGKFLGERVRLARWDDSRRVE